MTIHQKINAFRASMTGEHHRYLSWEHCYSYFRKTTPQGLSADRNQAALQLAFYLASWGMYRGSSFLLQHSYTVHLRVIDLLGERRFAVLWKREIGASATDENLVPTILEVIDGIREAYQPFAPTANSQQPTDTLITKVLLGTLACLPACDRYFIDGFKREGFSYSCLNQNFIKRVLGFCQENLQNLRKEQAAIGSSGGMSYPLMKLIDMYFWQIGFEQARAKR